MKHKIDIGSQVIRQIVAHTKYNAYLKDLQRRETIEENIAKNKKMHLDRFPHMDKELDFAYGLVEEGRVLPSMRSLQFGGSPILKHNAKSYNCSYAPIDSIYSISEAMYLLLCGTGFGYSVRHRHVNQLPAIKHPDSDAHYVIEDSIEGWADAVKVLLESRFGHSRFAPKFIFDNIRPAGSRLSSGVIAPGPAKLEKALNLIETLLDGKKEGDKLTPLETSDIVCYVADCVVSGGVRRSALICLFDWNDVEMLQCKVGDWWETNPQRGRSNNSAALNSTWPMEVLKERFDFVVRYTREALLSGSGDPGFLFMSDDDYGVNPCAEALLHYNFCNLCEIVGNQVETQKDFDEAAHAAAIIGTFQASLTDFKYLRPIWKERTEKEALLGVGITAMVEGKTLDLDMWQAGTRVNETNALMAGSLGINRAHRTTVIKPSGTSTLYAGAHGSGIHDAPSETSYLRRIRIGKTEALYGWLAGNMPALLEDEAFDPMNTAVLTIPRYVDSSTIKHWAATPFEFAERVKHVYDNWIMAGHNQGPNGGTHNVSATVYLEPSDHDAFFEWMWDNRDHYRGMALLPKTNANYPQLPIEPCDDETYSNLVQYLVEFDPKQVFEPEDMTSFGSEAACAGGQCTID